MTPPATVHNYIVMRVSNSLYNFVEAHDLGFVFGDNTGYALSQWRLVMPDVSFISKSRLTFPLPQIISSAPDLAIEVIPPSNTITEMNQKIEDYLMYGTKIVWVIYPQTRTVDVWHQLDDKTLTKNKFGIQDTLSGEDVLPNFTLSVAKIFPPQA